MPATERLAIFIDGSNCYHSVKELLGLHDNEKVDFSKLIAALSEKKLLIDARYYNAPLDRGHNPQVYSKQQRFFSELRRIPGVTVILCTMRKIRNSNGSFDYAVKGDDIHIATDMLSFAYENKYDTAVLVSGDGDFVPVIEKVRKLGKKVINAHFSVNRADVLRKVCDSSILLDDIVRKCLK